MAGQYLCCCGRMCACTMRQSCSSPVLLVTQGAKAAVVEEMGRLFLAAGLKDVLPLPKARVPVVKLVTPSTSTKVTIHLV